MSSINVPDLSQARAARELASSAEEPPTAARDAMRAELAEVNAKLRQPHRYPPAVQYEQQARAEELRTALAEQHGLATLPAEPRTWDAVITCYPTAGTTGGEEVPADAPEHDLLRECAHSALREAAKLVEHGLCHHASVAIYKTTKARGREYDRPGGSAYSDGARVVAVGWGR